MRYGETIAIRDKEGKNPQQLGGRKKYRCYKNEHLRINITNIIRGYHNRVLNNVISKTI